MNNSICDMFGIRYPILLGGMLYTGRAGLVAAVSEAGGLGVLGAGRMETEALIEEVVAIRKLTSKPFGVNIPLRTPNPQQLIESALKASVKIFSTSGASPAVYTREIKSAGAKVLHVVATVHQALKAEDAGVDAIVAEGAESGGIASKDQTTTLTLVPQVVDAVKLPVIAAGGISDGRGLAAAIALGAIGVQMGTRFLASVECGIAPDLKKAILLATDTDTELTVNEHGVLRRTLKTELVQKAQIVTGRSSPEDEHASGDHSHHGRSAGQGAGLIHEILPVREIIQRMMAQAVEVAGKQLEYLKHF